jgi:hypothetical protein
MTVKHQLVMNLIPDISMDELDMGEAGVSGKYTIVDNLGKKIGTYATWYNGTSGLFIGEFPDVTRVVLPKGFATVTFTR